MLSMMNPGLSHDRPTDSYLADCPDPHSAEIREKFLSIKSSVTMQSVNLLAFNLFGADVRRSVREDHVGAGGAEVEKLIGARWGALPEKEKAAYVEAARLEQAKLFTAAGLDPEEVASQQSDLMAHASRRLDAEGKPIARKRGRPRKNNTLADGTPGASSAPSKKALKRMRRKHKLGRQEGIDPTLVGAEFEGLIDGVFDIGYFVTAWILERDPSSRSEKGGLIARSFRGLAFRPDLAVTMCEGKDLVYGAPAPAPSFTPRADDPLAAHPQHASPPRESSPVPPMVNANSFSMLMGKDYKDYGVGGHAWMGRPFLVNTNVGVHRCG
eukprot:jgi/Mesvir1/12582/Mv10330-RA.1